MSESRICRIAGCKRPRYARKLCTLHYQQWRKTYEGPPLKGLTVGERFWSKVDRDGPEVFIHRQEVEIRLGRCWSWTGAVGSAGYGVFGIDPGTRSAMAHRVAYEMECGPIPDGYQVDHLCKNRLCVNAVGHLVLVTVRQNQLRSDSVSAMNAAKEYCINGHPFSPDNTYVDPDGRRRRCRACAAEEEHQRRQTTFDGTSNSRPDEETRFWTKVDRNGSGGCWLWTGLLGPFGYGLFSVRRGPEGSNDWHNDAAHRYAYELLVGPIPEGLTIGHLCHDTAPECPGGPTCMHRRCVNPEHLGLQTRGENSLLGSSDAAKNARKTHCKRNHPLSGDNLYINPSGQRRCKTCHTQRQVEYMERKRRREAGD